MGGGRRPPIGAPWVDGTELTNFPMSRYRWHDTPRWHVGAFFDLVSPGGPEASLPVTPPKIFQAHALQLSLLEAPHVDMGALLPSLTALAAEAARLTAAAAVRALPMACLRALLCLGRALFGLAAPLLAIDWRGLVTTRRVNTGFIVLDSLFVGVYVL